MIKPITTPIRYLKGIGPKRAEIFSRLGISTIEDLLYYFPRRYEDRREFRKISQLKEGELATIHAEVLARGSRRSFQRRSFSITEIAVGDESGKIYCVWFNQPYLANYFKVGDSLILYGKLEHYGAKPQLVNPEFEAVSQDADDDQVDSLNIGRIVPVYGLSQGITQRYLRKIIKSALGEYLSNIMEFLPFRIREDHRLFDLTKSLLNIHFPEDPECQKEAYRRLSFEEFLLFQLPLVLRKSQRKEKIGIAHKVEGKLVKDFIANLSFSLTSAQVKVIGEIKQDMAQNKPMQRLLQGDVGSGKTVVATIATLFAVQGGYQAAFMAPTEILAKQHFDKISSEFRVQSSELANIKLALLVSSISQKEKDDICQRIKEGKIDLIIGTHALLEEGVRFKKLGLAVIDEQHKFGVGQRALLPEKGVNPDVLIMTATPIPRTLAITLYGDLDISVITELPSGRKPIKTKWIKTNQRTGLYNFLKKRLVAGDQAFIVYPLIEESYALDLLSAKKMYSELKKVVPKEYAVGLIHGQLKSREQEELMRDFKLNKIQVMVATTILEVGIDVANATVMVVEQAERFGLSTLHQLRGRIGRGVKESFCVLVSDASSSEAKARLSVMVKYLDGFRIAEEDLRIRGPGEFFGQRQHGLTELKIGDPLAQLQLLKQAREEAIRTVKGDPHLNSGENALLKDKLLQRFPEYQRMMVVG